LEGFGPVLPQSKKEKKKKKKALVSFPANNEWDVVDVLPLRATRLLHFEKELSISRLHR
jgi:hypothetical protein